MIPDKVKAVLDAHGLTAVEFEPGSCATSVLAAHQFGVAVGQIAKSLLFLGKNGKMFLVICPGDRRISSSKLKAVVGVKCTMADGDAALSATGFPPGGVCPFGVDPSIPVFIDRALSGYQRIFPAAGTDGSGVPMSFQELVDATGGTVGDFLTDGEATGGPAPA